jgi:hypothetical protein
MVEATTLEPGQPIKFLIKLTLDAAALGDKAARRYYHRLQNFG